MRDQVLNRDKHSGSFISCYTCQPAGYLGFKTEPSRQSDCVSTHHCIATFIIGIMFVESRVAVISTPSLEIHLPHLSLIQQLSSHVVYHNRQDALANATLDLNCLCTWHKQIKQHKILMMLINVSLSAGYSNLCTALSHEHEGRKAHP